MGEREALGLLATEARGEILPPVDVTRRVMDTLYQRAHVMNNPAELELRWIAAAAGFLTAALALPAVNAWATLADPQTNFLSMCSEVLP